MIYYPLSLLMLAGIQDILIITTPEDSQSFINLLGDGSQFGISLSYAVQEQPDGLAQAFIIGEEFVGNDSVALVLGDNILHGHAVSEILRDAANNTQGATIFGYRVSDPERYGVVEFDADYKAVSIEEKPQQPKSNYAVIGLYFYDNSVVSMAKSLTPSPRGELEITDINARYLAQDKLDVKVFGRGYAWFDTGTHNSLLEAGNFVRTLSERQSVVVSSPEEIAWRNNWLSDDELIEMAHKYSKNMYGRYLASLLEHA